MDRARWSVFVALAKHLDLLVTTVLMEACLVVTERRRQ